MKCNKSWVKRKSSILSNQQGQGLVEYVGLLLLVVLTVMTITKTVGTTVKGKMEEARSHIDTDIKIN